MSSSRRWTREQLLQSLQLIDDLVTPLPHALPPSPPASRSPSPALGTTKRKHEPSRGDNDQVKRQRTSSSARSSTRTAAPASYRAYSHRAEDGELYEDHSTRAVTATPPTFVPVRRPKAVRPDLQTFNGLYTKWYQAGRQLKYSGDVRFRSTFPPNHSHYHALSDPPPPNSPYHKFGGIIAQLESMDALISFTYAMWAKDMATSTCNEENWKTIDAFLEWCKTKWGPDKSNSANEAEKGFYGLIWQIEAFIRARLISNYSKLFAERPLKELGASVRSAVAQAADKAETETAFSDRLGTCSTPKMLPSPASIGPSNSANSTPTSRDSGTPDPSHHAASSASAAANGSAPSVPLPLPIPSKMMPPRLQEMHRKGQAIPQHVLDAMGTATGSITPNTAQKMSELTYGVLSARHAVNQSQAHLTLPVMYRAFPRTYARMVLSTLDVNEEWSPDFEDEEGELFWPGQALNGEGLGWVCLMGKAMIQEFGKPYGYRGLNGIIPKTVPTASQSLSSRAGSAVNGRSPMPTTGSSSSLR